MARRKQGPGKEDSPRRRTARRSARTAGSDSGRPAAPRSRGRSTGGSRGPSARGSRRPSAQGCLFWVVLLAVVVAVAYAAREPLKQAFNRYLGSGGEASGPTRPAASAEAGPAPAAPAAAPSP